MIVEPERDEKGPRLSQTVGRLSRPIAEPVGFEQDS
jgi:hypothetical protein